MRLPQIEIININGIKIRTGVWKADKPGAKRAVLFFNGIGANLELAYPIAERIHDRDFITFDVPGIGGSPNTVMPYRMWRLARWIKAMTKKLGYSRFDIIGVSWGGTIAQQFAFQYPSTVGSAALAASTPGALMVPGKLKSLSKMFHFKRYSQPEFLKANFQELYGEELTDSGSRYALLMRPPTAKGYIYQLGALAGWSSLPFLPFLRQRFLIIMGDRDTVVPAVNGRLMAACIRKARLSLVENAGHLFMVTRSETVVPEILSFFDQNTVSKKRALSRYRK